MSRPQQEDRLRALRLNCRNMYVCINCREGMGVSVYKDTDTVVYVADNSAGYATG